jgi:hypothetical protein
VATYAETLERFPQVRFVAPAEWTRGNRHTGIRRLMVELSRAGTGHQ